MRTERKADFVTTIMANEEIDRLRDQISALKASRIELGNCAVAASHKMNKLEAKFAAIEKENAAMRGALKKIVHVDDPHCKCDACKFGKPALAIFEEA